MLKRVLYFIALILLSFSSEYSFAQFPYNESFRNSVARGIKFGGSPDTAFLTARDSRVNDPEGDGYLRLTNNNRDQKGYIYSETSFPSKYGLKMELEYYTYGGNGADGITFFLFDADANPFNIGAFGGSLGYAQKNTTNPVSPGVSKGYIGIGLDEYGNFSNPTEGRQGGIVGPVAGGLSPSSVTLRGKGNGSDFTPENYKYLTSVQTPSLGFNLTGGGGVRHSSPASSGYRKVLIDLQPAPDPQTGYLITVKILVGGAAPKTYTVIDAYHYPEAAPANLKYGIASSTGFYTNIHEIRNVAIDLYDETKLSNPVATSDLVETCFDQPVTIGILANDVTANSGGTLLASSIDLNPGETGTQQSMTVAGKGQFAVNELGVVTFTPLDNTITGPVAISYTVSDSYNKTSLPATITVRAKPLAPANAGTDQELSIETGTASASMNASLQAGTSGIWTQVSGPQATIADNTSPTSAVTNMDPGTYVFQWSVSGPANCPNNDQVRILVINPSIPAAIDDEVSTTSGTAAVIEPLKNDRFIRYQASPATFRVSTAAAHGTVSYNPGTSTATYAPGQGFSGTDSFTYTVNNTNGIVSNVATVTIRVRPVGINDTAVTPINTAVTVPVKENDPSASGTTVVPASPPVHGTVVFNTAGTVTYTPNQDFKGKDAFTYILKTAEGLASDPVSVDLTVNVLPVAEDDVAPPSSGGPIEIDVTSNDRDADGNIIHGTVEITEQPKHGTVTVDPVTGKVRYVPDPGYFGPDSFSYVVRDDQGGVSQPGTVKLTVFLPPKVGLAKAVTKIQQALNGSYDVEFTFTVKNFGSDPLQNISLQDNLATAFSGTAIRVNEVRVVGAGLTANTAYNGTSNTELLSSTSTLEAGAIELVVLSVNFRLVTREGNFSNTAVVSGFSTLFNTDVNDQSTNGLRPDPQAEGDVSYSDPTVLELLAPPIFIPGGFSPNEDGINDLFVIQNKITKRISLEIFNRWGNRIYRSADYQNDWNGTSTEGISSGEQVPNGTYYYVIVIDDTEKRAGYLTINR